jgi:cytochrome c oxidase subunit 2
MTRWLPEAASSYAGDIDGLLVFITVVVGVWFLLAEGLLVYMALRYRRRKGRPAAYLPGRTLRSMAFVLVPCAVILGFDLWIDAVAAPVWHQIKETAPPAEQTVRISGERWLWRFTYPGPDGALGTPDDIESVSELHVPVNQTVVFELTAKDVLHSLWVPELRLKQDAVPGRTIRGWFRAIREGRYEVICAEICGLLHTNMKATLVVEPAADYLRWLQSKTSPARAESIPQEVPG